MFLDVRFVPLSDRRSCFYLLFPLVVVFPGSGLMAFVLAIDRLLAVIIPTVYLKFNRNYAVKLSLGGYSLALPILIASIVIVSRKEYGGTQVESYKSFNKNIKSMDYLRFFRIFLTSCLDFWNMRILWSNIPYYKQSSKMCQSRSNSSRDIDLHTNHMANSKCNHSTT